MRENDTVMPEEYRPLPHEYTEASPVHPLPDEYNADHAPPPLPPKKKRRPKKMLKYILGTAAAGIVITASVGVLPDADVAIQTHSDLYDFVFPSTYTYTLEEGNEYRISYDTTKNEDYYDYIAGYLYTMCQTFPEERVEAARQGRDTLRFRVTLTDEPFYSADSSIINASVSHQSYGWIDSDTNPYISEELMLFNIPFVETGWMQEEIVLGLPSLVASENAKDGDPLRYLRSVEGIDIIHFKEHGWRVSGSLFLTEDAICFGEQSFENFFDSYNWAKDKSYSEIRRYLAENSTLDEPRELYSIRTCQFVLVSGSFDLILPSFMKIETIETQ